MSLIMQLLHMNCKNIGNSDKRTEGKGIEITLNSTTPDVATISFVLFNLC